MKVIKAEYKPPPEIDMEVLMNKFEEIAMQQIGMETCRISCKEIDGLEEWKTHKISRSSTGIYVALMEKQVEDYQNIIKSVIGVWNTNKSGILNDLAQWNICNCIADKVDMCCAIDKIR